MPPRLSALGFCGVDDTVHVDQLLLIVQSFPNVEFGVLFRPDLEGKSRYASPAWVHSLTSKLPTFIQQTGITPKLAAHLCGSRVNELLNDGDTTFLETIVLPAFGRVQINATAVNGVDTSRLSAASTHATLHNIIIQLPHVEFILQKNDETLALCDGLERLLEHSRLPNVAMLHDESKGTGVRCSSWPVPTTTSTALYKMGYAGGIGPDNVTEVLQSIVCQDIVKDDDDAMFWIDMESSLRSTKNDRDVFDLDKCYAVIDAVCTMGLMQKPPFLR
jgi:hypothetical protein